MAGCFDLVRQSRLLRFEVARSAHPRHTRGFTLIELMVTLAVAAILAMIAVPSFRHALVGTHLSSLNNELAGDLAYARTEAVSQQANVAVAASANNWQNGWTVQVAPSSTAPGVVPTVLRRHAAIGSQYTLDGNGATTITFHPQGNIAVPAAGSTAPPPGNCFTIFAPSGSHNNTYYLAVLAGGALQQVTVASGGTTAPPAGCKAP